MATFEKRKAQAKLRMKKVFEAIQVFEHAVGQMEVDGWFGGKPTTSGLSTCKLRNSFGGNELVCADGGPVCAGIAIYNAAHQRCQLRRWNKDRTNTYVSRHLDLFIELAELGITVRPQNGLRGIPSWNDAFDIGYAEVKAAFGVALKKLTTERYALSQEFGFAQDGQSAGV